MLLLKPWVPTVQQKGRSELRDFAVGWRLRTLPAKTTGELDVLGLDGHTLGVDGGQVGVFEETDEVGFRGLLKSTDGRGLLICERINNQGPSKSGSLSMHSPGSGGRS